jgi:hypothetical protein
MRRRYLALGAVAIAGLAVGVVLDVSTWLLATRGPSGDGWSLRGNGALVVPLGVAPALLAAGWAAIVAHHRSLPNWAVLGVLAGVVALGLVALSFFAVVAGGPTGSAVSAVATILVPLWMLAAPLIVSLLPSRGRPPDQRGVGVHVLAAIALTVAIGAGFLLTQRALPPGA